MRWRRNKPPVTRERRSESPAASSGQILWLIAVIFISGAPHFVHVHPWVPLVVLSILVWRVIAAARRKPLPGAFVRVTLTLFGFFGVLLSYRQVTGLNAGSALLLIMAAMKLLETRGHRDRAVVIFICYFMIFATFVREQAIWSSAYLILGVLMTTTALLQTARTGRILPIPMALAYSTRLILQALPVALILFLLFPRIPGPFWSLPTMSSNAVSGLSDELSPGDISELALSDKVAFRVRFDTPPPVAAELYWRGPVMDIFNGRKWVQRPARPAVSAGAAAPNGRLIDYEITLEPHGQNWLLALERPLSWDARGAVLSTLGQLVRELPVEQRMSYRSTSTLGDSKNRDEDPVELNWNRSLPAGMNPRSQAFAGQLRDAADSDSDYLQKILRHFRAEPFYYTLTPPSLGEHPIDEFLFDSRRGFCGHYASAFAMLARAGGIPARVVTGYQGAEKNPLGGYWIVRQSDAHAWTEVWIEGRWIRFDPTAIVAPDRIEFGFEEAMERRDEISAGRLTDNRLFVRMAMSWDALNANWNRWVLSFGPESQATLLSLAGIRNPEIAHLVIAMAGLITLTLVAIGITQRLRARPRPDRLFIAYNQLCAKLGKQVRQRAPHEGPDEYWAAIQQDSPALAAEARGLFDLYLRLRYDAQPDAARTEKFLAAVRAFRPMPRTAPG